MVMDWWQPPHVHYLSYIDASYLPNYSLWIALSLVLGSIDADTVFYKPFLFNWHICKGGGASIQLNKVLVGYLHKRTLYGL